MEDKGLKIDDRRIEPLAVAELNSRFSILDLLSSILQQDV